MVLSSAFIAIALICLAIRMVEAGNLEGPARYWLRLTGVVVATFLVVQFAVLAFIVGAVAATAM
ncbi:MAG TPA: hypothetical protein VFL55_09350 [Acetobacteraceae bacterium]|nr:hypothetical protein [Acetobacteraceae bacterium]